jgi:hypothetical protein
MLVLVAGAARTLHTGAARGLKKGPQHGMRFQKNPLSGLGWLSTLLPSARLLCLVLDRSGPWAASTRSACGIGIVRMAWQALHPISVSSET